MKAVDAAIFSRQWKKAVEILQTQDGNSTLIYYKKIADHFASSGEFDVRPFFKYYQIKIWNKLKMIVKYKNLNKTEI